MAKTTTPQGNTAKGFPEERFGALLHEVARRWRGALDTRLKPLGLSQAKWRTLFYLQMHDAPLNQKTLANLLGVEGPTLVGLLDRLGREGWLTRREDQADRRCKDVVLLPKARETARHIQGIAFDLENELLQGISREDLAACMRVMQLLRARMLEPTGVQQGDDRGC